MIRLTRLVVTAHLSDRKAQKLRDVDDDGRGGAGLLGRVFDLGSGVSATVVKGGAEPAPGETFNGPQRAQDRCRACVQHGGDDAQGLVPGSNGLDSGLAGDDVDMCGVVDHWKSEDVLDCQVPIPIDFRVELTAYV